MEICRGGCQRGHPCRKGWCHDTMVPRVRHGVPVSAAVPESAVETGAGSEAERATTAAPSPPAWPGRPHSRAPTRPTAPCRRPPTQPPRARSTPTACTRSYAAAPPEETMQPCLIYLHRHLFGRVQQPHRALHHGRPPGRRLDPGRVDHQPGRRAPAAPAVPERLSASVLDQTRGFPPGTGGGSGGSVCGDRGIAPPGRAGDAIGKAG